MLGPADCWPCQRKFEQMNDSPGREQLSVLQSETLVLLGFMCLSLSAHMGNRLKRFVQMSEHTDGT